MTDQDKFQKRVSQAEGGLSFDKSADLPHPNISSLATAGSFDLGKLDLGAAQDLDIMGAVDNIKSKDGSGLQISSDLSKLDEGIRRIQVQEANQKVRDLIVRAQKEMERKNYLTAINLLDQALGIESTSGEIWFLKGYCYFTMDDFEVAIPALDQARRFASDSNTVIMVMILQAICMRSATEKIAEQIQDLIEKGLYLQALALVDRELRKQPDNPALFYHRGGILMLLNRLKDAENYVSKVINQVNPDNANMLKDLLDVIHFRQHEQDLERARQALRKGNATEAVNVLEKYRSKLEGITKFDSLFSYASERMPGGFLGTKRVRTKPLTEQNRQQTLQWVLSEELDAGMAALEKESFSQVREQMGSALRIDAHCGLACFLYALAIMKEFEATLEKKQRIDVDQSIRSLTDAAAVAKSAQIDPQFRIQAIGLNKAIDHYVAQLHELTKMQAKARQEAKPVNDLVQSFNNVMDNLNNKGVSSPRDLDDYEKKFRNIHAEAEKLRRGRSVDEGSSTLSDLMKAADQQLSGIANAREQIKVGKMVGECLQEFNNLMSHYKSKPISNYNQLQDAKSKLYAIQTKIRQVRSANPTGENADLLNKLAEAIQNVLNQLTG